MSPSKFYDMYSRTKSLCCCNTISSLLTRFTKMSSKTLKVEFFLKIVTDSPDLILETYVTKTSSRLSVNFLEKFDQSLIKLIWPLSCISRFLSTVLPSSVTLIPLDFCQIDHFLTSFDFGCCNKNLTIWGWLFTGCFFRFKNHLSDLIFDQKPLKVEFSGLKT